DPSMERLRLHAGLPDTPTAKGLGMLVAGRTGQRGMPHPEVRAVPAGGLLTGTQCRAKERPLGAPVASLFILQVGCDVPPFDAVAVVRAVAPRELEGMAPNHLSEVAGLLAQAGKAGFGFRLGGIVACGKQHHCAGQYGADASVHRKIVSAGLRAGAGPAATRVRQQRECWSAHRAARVAATAAEKHAWAGASRMPGH